MSECHLRPQPLSAILRPADWHAETTVAMPVRPRWSSSCLSATKTTLLNVPLEATLDATETTGHADFTDPIKTTECVASRLRPRLACPSDHTARLTAHGHLNRRYPWMAPVRHTLSHNLKSARPHPECQERPRLACPSDHTARLIQLGSHSKKFIQLGSPDLVPDLPVVRAAAV